jgi:transglutaminase-like putative cysteine protease
LNNKRLIFSALLLLSVGIPIAAIVYKLTLVGYSVAELVPVLGYQVDVNMQVDGHGGDIDISTYLPRSDSRQTVMDEENASGIFELSLQSSALNRIATWQATNVRGQQTIRYRYTVLAKHVRYVIPDTLTIPQSYPDHLQPYLAPAPGIQVNDPLIAETIEKLFPDHDRNILHVLTRLHRYLQDEFTNKDFSGFTDALTALKLQEASCNGKGRLFVALARRLNLPARLVGGVILNSGSKRTSHQWVEVYVNNYWVPFDTINDHFAEIPGNFLALYYGDLVLFKHTSNTNFQYSFNISKHLMAKSRTHAKYTGASHAGFDFYALFEEIGVSQNLLKILIMLPFGALVVVIFRNVIGLETFGTFLPALIAAAARETGLLWGLIGFVLIILVASMLRKLLDWVQLLHSPKMAIILTVVVVVMLIMSMISVRFGLFELAHISLFPIAILAITAERFAIVEAEQGWKKAMQISAMTIVVISACYVVMDSLFLQNMVLAFPETLLLVIALNLWLGKWIGMRLYEFYRFRRLIFAK